MFSCSHELNSLRFVMVNECNGFGVLLCRFSNVKGLYVSLEYPSMCVQLLRLFEESM